MAEVAIQNEADVSAGGFHIEIRPDELTVTADKSAIQPRKRSPLRNFLTVLVCVFAALYLVLVFVPAMLKGGITKVAVLALVVVPSLLWAYLRGSKNLHCTRDNLEVIHVVHGRVRNNWLFPKNVVRNIRFAPVAYSKYGSTCGLVFTVRGKKVKTLYGIECPEAQIVLKQLDRLGFDVVHDVGMPMMVEMALERRNSCLNI
jgi:hypothetical protein